MEEGVDIMQQVTELRQLSVPALAARYEALFGKPPRVKNQESLWRACARRLQEQSLGGLSASAGSERPAKPPKPGLPAIGTILVREWRGTQVQVRVLEDGFEWNGVVYKSLSAVAKAVTGAHWNGRLFFGLAERKKTS